MPTAHKGYSDFHVAAVGLLQLRTPSIAVGCGVLCAAAWRRPVVTQDGGALLRWALLALQMQRAFCFCRGFRSMTTRSAVQVRAHPLASQKLCRGVGVSCALL